MDKKQHFPFPWNVWDWFLPVFQPHLCGSACGRWACGSGWSGPHTRHTQRASPPCGSCREKGTFKLQDEPFPHSHWSLLLAQRPHPKMSRWNRVFQGETQPDLGNSLQAVVPSPLGDVRESSSGGWDGCFSWRGTSMGQNRSQRRRNSQHTQIKAALSFQCPKFLRGLWEQKKNLV